MYSVDDCASGFERWGFRFASSSAFRVLYNIILYNIILYSCRVASQLTHHFLDAVRNHQRMDLSRWLKDVAPGLGDPIVLEVRPFPF